MKDRPNDPPNHGILRQQVTLARYTSWRVGGPARQLYQPTDEADLSRFLARLPTDEPLLWLGLGSNLLVRDAGFAGTVIALHGRLAQFEITGTQLHVGAGAACARVARAAARAGLAGATFLAGIPGTIGGALAMNAGAFGGETWECVQQVRTIDRQGVCREQAADAFQVAYRQVNKPADMGFLGATLQFRPGEATQEQARIRELLQQRSTNQPTGKPSGGSTFRNPPGDFAARLIEACGLKGYQIGGAQVSVKHANFILNTGTATAWDIEHLIMYLQTEVRRQQGVLLQPEVHIIGETR
ncbi:MAG: UDP-N-acetylmuramate dehydrogenase [Pseudomonadota bacterium]